MLLLGEGLDHAGRRAAGSLVFNVTAGVVLAAAIGRSRSQLAAFALAGTELQASVVDHAMDAGPDDPMPVVADHLAALIAGSDRPVLGVGVSLPGVSAENRAVRLAAPVMPDWAGTDLWPAWVPDRRCAASGMG